MNKIGVFYGSTTGTAEDLAGRIAEKLGVSSEHVFPDFIVFCLIFFKSVL